MRRIRMLPNVSRGSAAAQAGRLLSVASAVAVLPSGRAIRRLEALVDLEHAGPVGHPEGSVGDAEVLPADVSPESPALSLLAELEHADDLDLESRLVLLRRVESTIATSLEGLDGL
jgi:hypothetical protein